jgi:hypothetical protein
MEYTNVKRFKRLNYAPRVHTVSSHNLMMLCFIRYFLLCFRCTDFSPVSRRLVRQTLFAMYKAIELYKPKITVS